MSLAELAALRGPARRRISWTALFLKAYGLVSADTRQLRQAYQPWPWPHLLEMPTSVGMVAINRHNEESGEDRLCWGRFIRPEKQSLLELQEALEQYQTQPIKEVFAQQVRLSKAALPIRRLIWWFNLNVLGGMRATTIGTFGMSALAGQGAWNRSHPSCLTTSLTYGPLDERGQMLVTLICDHRVLDGLAAAHALADLEAALCGPVAAELASLGKQRAVA